MILSSTHLIHYGMVVKAVVVMKDHVVQLLVSHGSHRDYGSTTTTDYLELRVCQDSDTTEDSPVSYYEIYVTKTNVYLSMCLTKLVLSLCSLVVYLAHAVS